MTQNCVSFTFYHKIKTYNDFKDLVLTRCFPVSFQIFPKIIYICVDIFYYKMMFLNKILSFYISITFRNGESFKGQLFLFTVLNKNTGMSSLFCLYLVHVESKNGLLYTGTNLNPFGLHAEESSIFCLYNIWQKLKCLLIEPMSVLSNRVKDFGCNAHY